MIDFRVVLGGRVGQNNLTICFKSCKSKDLNLFFTPGKSIADRMKKGKEGEKHEAEE